jgi:hypothetical protein
VSVVPENTKISTVNIGKFTIHGNNSCHTFEETPAQAAECHADNTAIA